MGGWGGVFFLSSEEELLGLGVSVGLSVGSWKILTKVLNRGMPYVSLCKPYVSLRKLT